VTVVIDHVLVPASDKHAAARFLAEMLDLEVTDESAGSPPGRFAVVRVGGVAVDFDDAESFDGQHYAFRVSDEEFDAILERVQAAGIEHSADPMHRRRGEINTLEGGRGFYFHSPDGHNLEVISRPGWGS
jgi:catechol 2,3-dioxygenase-like lactoylglutathione lyase family enzyme